MRQELRHLTTRVSPTVVGRASKVEDKSMERKGLTPEQVADTFKWDRKYGSSSLTSCIMVKLWYRNDLRHYKPRLDQHDRLYVNTGFYSKGREYITDCSIISCDFAGKVSFTYLVTKPEPKPTPQPTEDKSMERNEMQRINKVDAEYQKARLNRDKALQDWQANRISDHQLQQAEDSLSRAYAARRLAWIKADVDNLLHHSQILRAHGQYSTALHEHAQALRKDKEDNGFRHGTTAVKVEECHGKLCKALREIPLEQRDAYFSYVVTADGRQAFLTIEQALKSLTQWANLMGLKRIGDGKVAREGQVSLHAAPAIY